MTFFHPPRPSIPCDTVLVFFSVTYDFESLLQVIELGTEHTQYTQKHVPLSVSIYHELWDPATARPASFAPEFFVDAHSPTRLIEEFLARLHELSDWAYAHKRERYRDIYEQLDRRIDDTRALLARKERTGRDRKGARFLRRALRRKVALYNRFDDYLRQLLVCGYNSAKYDVNLLLGVMVKALRESGSFRLPRGPGRPRRADPNADPGNSDPDTDEDDTDLGPARGRGSEPREKRRRVNAAGDRADDEDMDQLGDAYKFSIRRQTKFLTFQTDFLRLADVLEMVGGGVSLRQFLQCFKDDDEDPPGGEPDEQKLFFPYEKLATPQDLDREGLPAYDDFWSTLKQCNVLEEGGGRARGEENYALMKRVWERHGMRTWLDLLRAYNNSDTLPLYRSTQRMIDMYRQLGVGVFDYLTLPSLAYDFAMRRCRRRLWSTPDWLAEMYHQQAENVIGGFASPLVQRRFEAGSTRIRPDVYGDDALLGHALKVLDFNSLYPAVMRGPLPCGEPKVRVYPDFELVTRRTRFMNSVAAIDYARWLAHSKGCHVQHAGLGYETKVGPYAVDAFAPSTNEVFEFYGCRWHAHDCPACPVPPHERREAEAKRRADLEKERYVRGRGFKWTRVWECEWSRTKREDPRVRAFFDESQQRETTRDDRDVLRWTSCFRPQDGPVNLQLILDKVRSGELFGFLVVDAHIPADRVKDFQNYPVIMQHMRLGRQQLTSDQLRVAVLYDLLKTPSKTVAGCDRGSAMLVTCDVVRFWLEVGVRVTHVAQVIEYKAISCLRQAIDDLVELRRQGDQSQRKALIAKAAKIILNSVSTSPPPPPPPRT